MIDLQVTPDAGEPWSVTALPRDILVWEKTNKAKKVFETLMDQLSLIDLYHLAWITSRRQGLFTGELELFERTCDVEPAGDASEAPDPTQPALSAEPSSSSPSPPASRRVSGPRKASARSSPRTRS